MINHSYATWLIVTGALALILAGFVWRRRTAPGGQALFLLFVTVTIWAWAYGVYWLTPSGVGKYFCVAVLYVGIALAPTALFILVLEFTNRGSWLTFRAYVLLAILPFLSLLLIWTDSAHHLFFNGVNVFDPNSLFRGGPWFWFNLVYSYALVLVGLAILVFEFQRGTGLYRRQLGVLIVAILLPVIGNLLGLSGHPLFAGLDLTPMLLLGTCVVCSYGIFGLGLMDLVHVSREALVESLEEGILVLDLQDRVMDLNRRAMELASPVDSPVGRPLSEVFSRWKDLLAIYNVPKGRFQLQLPRPPFSHLDLTIQSLNDSTGRPVGRLVTWHDVTEEKQTQENLRIFGHALEQSPSAIMITDANSHIEYVNAQFTRLTGYALDEVRGKTPRVLKSGETSDSIYKELWDSIKVGEVWEGEILNRKKNGSLYWAQQLIAPVLDSEGKVGRYVAMQQDITERKHTEAELRMMNTRLQVQLMEIERLHDQLREEAIRDSLTRLFNRRYMEESLERELSRAAREHLLISVVMMDVDLFKSINDTYGHQAGDTVLQTLGTMLLENTRISDIACRYGGDEMVVVMPGASLQSAVSRAEEWRAAFSLLEFSLEDARVTTTLSLGVASFPDHAQTLQSLLAAADRALYQAKTRRNSVVLYDPESMANNHHRFDDAR